MNIPYAPKILDDPQPPRVRADSTGAGEGMASLVCGALVIPSMLLTMVPTMFAMLFTRPDTGSNGTTAWSTGVGQGSGLWERKPRFFFFRRPSTALSPSCPETPCMPRLIVGAGVDAGGSALRTPLFWR